MAFYAADNVKLAKIKDSRLSSEFVTTIMVRPGGTEITGSIIRIHNPYFFIENFQIDINKYNQYKIK